MQIVVILGRVLDPSGITVKAKAGRIFVNRQEYILQPADRCALEAALQIKDTSGPEVQVTVLPRTLLPDDDLLRQALSLGADRAIYLTGAVEGLSIIPAAVMAPLLAAAVERLGGADLILTGDTTLDTGQSQLGPRLAAALGYHQLVAAWQVTVADGQAQVVRQEGSAYTRLAVPLPALVTLSPGTLKLRYPDGVRLVNIYKNTGEIAAALETWESGDLVAAESLAPLIEQRGQDFPPERERGLRVGGTPQEMAQVAADALRQRIGR